MKILDFIFHKKKEEEFIVDDTDKNTLFEETTTLRGKIANAVIIFFIMLSIFLVMFESIGDNSVIYLYYIFGADIIISLFFAGEYIYRFIHSDQKKKFPLRLINIFHLLSFLPFFIIVPIYGIGTYTILTIFRIFRIFKILELFTRVPILLKLFAGIKKHKFEYISGFFMIAIILIFFSTGLYFIENNLGGNDNFSSIPSTLWWAVVTMTTVGYGDMVPATTLGKIIGGMLMFLGPILIAIISSLTVFIFLESTKIIGTGKHKKCLACFTENSGDSHFCKNCGEKFEQ